MALAKQELALLGYSGAGTAGFREYVYANTGTDTVTTSGFFNGLSGQIETGDQITVQNTGQILRATKNPSTNAVTTTSIAAAA